MKQLAIWGAILVVVILVLWGMLSLLFLKRVDPGSAGIIIHYTTQGKPAIDNIPTGTYVWLNPFAGDVFVEYPTAQQSLVMSANSSEGEVQGDDSVLCQDKSGISINLDVTVLWQVNPAEVSTLYLLRPNDPLTGSFNSDIESTVVRPVVRNAITEACSAYQWDQIGGQKQQVIGAAASIIVPHLAEEGILVLPSNVFIGEIHYSADQQKAINGKAVAQQQAEQAQYDQQKAQYEAQAAVAQAQGEAQAIAILNAQLSKSPDYIQYLEIKEWDGKLPSTLVTSGNTNPVIASLGNGNAR